MVRLTSFQVGKRYYRFNVWCLAQFSEAFAGMVKLGTETTMLDGLSDEKPIILDDNPDDFEAFALWHLHFK